MVLTTYNPIAAPKSLAITTKTKSGKKENGIKYNGGETARRNERERESRREAGRVSDRRASPRLIVRLRYRRTIALTPPPLHRQGRTAHAGIRAGGRGGGGPCFTRLMCKIRRPGPVDAR